MDSNTDTVDKVFNLETLRSQAKDQDVAFNELISDEKRRVLEVRVRAGAVLKRHNTPEPITVLCVAGTGTFTAGDDLERSVELKPGTLLALDAEVWHEATAATDLQILVSKFK